MKASHARPLLAGLLALGVLAACDGSGSLRSRNAPSTSPSAPTPTGKLPASPGPVASQPLRPPTFLPRGTQLAVTPTYAQTGMRFLAVGKDGTAYAVHQPGASQLWASTDDARTWTPRGTALTGVDFRVMTVLQTGTLLADRLLAGNTHELARSDDGGRTWTKVLALGPMSILTPHSVDELDGTVFAAEYQAFTNDSVPVHVWASSDDGRTWELRQTFANRRHAHGLRTDPLRHEVWVFFGDNLQRTGMVRSRDAGRTFEDVLVGAPGSAVDGVFTERGLLFGQDLLYGSGKQGALMQLGDGPAPQPLFDIPGPSYSLHQTPVGGLVLCTTREPTGDTYADDSAHVLVSGDGETWDDVLQFPRNSPIAYARANVYWVLKSGELVLQLSGVTLTGAGDGYQLLRVEAIAPSP